MEIEPAAIDSNSTQSLEFVPDVCKDIVTFDPTVSVEIGTILPMSCVSVNHSLYISSEQINGAVNSNWLGLFCDVTLLFSVIVSHTIRSKFDIE